MPRPGPGAREEEDACAQGLEAPGPGPLFIRAAIRRGVPDELPRPQQKPGKLAARFRRHLDPTRAATPASA